MVELDDMPNEVLHLISEWLDDDFPALCTLRLTSKRWSCIIDEVSRWCTIKYDGAVATNNSNNKKGKGGNKKKGLDADAFLHMLEHTLIHLKHLSLKNCNSLSVQDFFKILDLRGDSLEELHIEDCSMLRNKHFYKLDQIFAKCPKLQSLTIWGDPDFLLDEGGNGLNKEVIRSALQMKSEKCDSPFRSLRINQLPASLSLLKVLSTYIEKVEMGSSLKFHRLPNGNLSPERQEIVVLDGKLWTVGCNRAYFSRYYTDVEMVLLPLTGDPQPKSILSYDNLAVEDVAIHCMRGELTDLYEDEGVIYVSVLTLDSEIVEVALPPAVLPQIAPMPHCMTLNSLRKEVQDLWKGNKDNDTIMVTVVTFTSKSVDTSLILDVWLKEGQPK